MPIMKAPASLSCDRRQADPPLYALLLLSCMIRHAVQLAVYVIGAVCIYKKVVSGLSSFADMQAVCQKSLGLSPSCVLEQISS